MSDAEKALQNVLDAVAQLALGVLVKDLDEHIARLEEAVAFRTPATTEAHAAPMRAVLEKARKARECLR